jgi:hypothetical protein
VLYLPVFDRKHRLAFRSRKIDPAMDVRRAISTLAAIRAKGKVARAGQGSVR